MKSLKKAISEIKATDRPINKSVSTEFQQYGVYLAETLDDKKHYALYIKLAKELPRHLLEEALNYTKDYHEAKSKAKIFMWKLKELRTSRLGN